MSSSRAAPEPVSPYVSRPPGWLKRAHATADLGAFPARLDAQSITS